MKLQIFLFFVVLHCRHNPALALENRIDLTVSKANVDFGCSGPCWQNCLDSVTSRSGQRIKDMVESIRNVRLSDPSISGTGFAIDSTENDINRFEFQQTLAAIVAITSPVQNYDDDRNKRCNPFFSTQYFENFAYTVNNCLDHCKAAEALLAMNHLRENPIPAYDQNEVACALLTGFMLDGNAFCGDSKYSLNEMLVSFFNSNDQSGLQTNSAVCNNLFPGRMVSVSIPPGAPPSGLGGVHHSLPYSKNNLEEAQSILKCMWSSCECKWNVALANAKTKAKESNSPIYYQVKGSDKILEFDGKEEVLMEKSSQLKEEDLVSIGKPMRVIENVDVQKVIP